MTSIQKTVWFFAGSLFSFTLFLGLGACSDHKVVVIQAGKFSEDWPTELRKELVKNSKCIIDQINSKSPQQGKITLKSGEPLNISGWAFSETDGALPAVYVQLVGPALTYTALAQSRVARPDVNQYFQLDPAWKTGFALQALQNIEPSEYELEILQPGSHSVARCTTKIAIKMEPATTGG